MTDQCADCKRYLVPRIDEEEDIKVYRVQGLPIGRRPPPAEEKLCERCFTKWKESPPKGYIPALFSGVWTLVRTGEETEILSSIEPKAARVKTTDDGDLVRAINRLAAAVESLVKKGTR